MASLWTQCAWISGVTHRRSPVGILYHNTCLRYRECVSVQVKHVDGTGSYIGMGVNIDGDRWTWMESKWCWDGCRCDVWEFNSTRPPLNWNNFRGLRFLGGIECWMHVFFALHVRHCLMLVFRCPCVSTKIFSTAVSTVSSSLITNCLSIPQS